MLRLAMSAALLAAFASINTYEPVKQVDVAAKCTGQDPCFACKNCHSCGHCKNGGTCGSCKTKKKLLAVNICQ